MSTSPPTTPLAPLWAAFAAAAGELTEPAKAAQADVQTRGGQRYSYRYLTLPQLSELVRAAFARHGLAFRQQVTTDDHRVAVVTTLVHTSGACWSSEPLTMHAASRAPQDLGSTMTYARRYQLAALVGLSGSDDDDAAGQHTPDPPTAGHDTPASPSRDAPAAGRKPTAKQLKYLHTLLGQHGYGSRESALAYLSGELDRPIESSGDLTAREVSDVIDKIKATPKADRSAVGDQPPADDPWSTEPEPTPWPPVAPVAPPVDDAAGEVTLDPPTQAEQPTQAATRRMFATLRGAGLTDRDTTLAWLSDHVGHTLTTSRELTAAEVSSVIDRLTDQQEQQ